jgi:hypothetical protein
MDFTRVHSEARSIRRLEAAAKAHCGNVDEEWGMEKPVFSSPFFKGDDPLSGG